MSSTRTKRVRTPVKCHLCDGNTRRKHERKERKETIEHTDVLDHRSIPEISVAEEQSHSLTLNEKTVVLPLEDFTPVPSVTLFDPHLSKALAEYGFTVEPELNEIYTNDWRAEMRLKYHGMGHCQVVGINPRLHGMERCYFIGIVGGNNAYEYEDNHRAFLRIGQYGTHYYTVDEILTSISESADREINLFDSAPPEQGPHVLEISSGYFEVTPLTNT